MVEVALPGQQTVVASVSWAWNSSFLARRVSKNIGKGLSGEKAPKDGAPSLEGFNSVGVAPGDKAGGGLGSAGGTLGLDGLREFSTPNDPVIP